MLSPDSNFVIRGSPNGFDMFVGVRNASGATTLTSGLYYESGSGRRTNRRLTKKTAAPCSIPITAYLTLSAGTLSATSAFSGPAISVRKTRLTPRLTQPLTWLPDWTDGGSAGSFRLRSVLGRCGGHSSRFRHRPLFGIEIGFPYTPLGGLEPGVYLDPMGVVNSASSAPFTAGIFPGEFLTFYNGVNLANSSTCATALPFPTMLGGVQVLVDNIPAPIYCVGSQITVIVPYEVKRLSHRFHPGGQQRRVFNVVTVYVRPPRRAS